MAPLLKNARLGSQPGVSPFAPWKGVAVTPAQIRAKRLQTRPTKKSDSRPKRFGAISVELDAIAPPDLRKLVQDAIGRHLPARQLKVLKVAQESEHTQLRGLVDMLKASGDRP